MQPSNDTHYARLETFALATFAFCAGFTIVGFAISAGLFR